MMETQTLLISSRPQAIVLEYLRELDKHMEELKAGRAERMFEIRELADMLNVHPGHLSNTIQDVLGKSPCAIYEERLLSLSKEMLATSAESITQIARRLTYDPSNFTKFFKRYSGMTPKQFRLTLQ